MNFSRKVTTLTINEINQIAGGEQNAAVIKCYYGYFKRDLNILDPNKKEGIGGSDTLCPQKYEDISKDAYETLEDGVEKYKDVAIGRYVTLRIK